MSRRWTTTIKVSYYRDEINKQDLTIKKSLVFFIHPVYSLAL